MTEVDSLAILEARSLNSRGREGLAPSEGTEGGPILASPRLQAPADLRQHHSSLWLCHQMPFFPGSVTQISLYLSLKKTLALEFRASINPRWSHLEVLNYVFRDAYPSQFTLTASRSHHSIHHKGIFKKTENRLFSGNVYSHLDSFFFFLNVVKTTFHLTYVLTGFNDLVSSCRLVRRILGDVLGLNKHLKNRWNLQVGSSSHFVAFFATLIMLLMVRKNHT